MISLLIVDDEPLSRIRIRRLLETTDYQVCGEAVDGEDALIAIDSLSPDVVLLDIHMPGTDGMEVARQVSRRPHPPAIIFVTAYDEYALHAFKVNAEDYLLKPVRKEDLLAALNNVIQLNKAQVSRLEANPAHRDGTRYVSCHSQTGVKRIAVENILYLHAEHKYVTVVHLQGENLCDDTLKELEQSLRPHVLRIHRHTLVNHSRIDRLQRTTDGHHLVFLHGLEQGLAVSRRMVSEIKKFLHSS